MKSLAVVALLSGIIGCSSPSASNSALEGLWSSDARTKGGLGSQISFTSDGRATITFGAVVDFTYRIEGNQLTTVFIEGGGKRQETSADFLIADDTLTLNPNDKDKKQIMKRVGAPMDATHPIVGEWTYKHYTGGQAIDRYSRQGAMQLSVPFQAVNGTYLLEGRRVTIHFEGQQPVTAELDSSGNKLLMKDGNATNAFSKFTF